MQRDIETEVKRGLGIDIPELRVEEAARAGLERIAAGASGPPPGAEPAH